MPDQESHGDGSDDKGKGVHGFFPEEVLADLRKSDLVPSDMQIRPLGSSERAATLCGRATRGYVIPYFDYKGNSTDFYRVKVINPEAEAGAKYKQPHRTSNRVYFPLGFVKVLEEWCKNHDDQRLIVLTEGEKKAACALKYGIPTVGFGGVDSWKTKKTELSASDTELTYNPNQKGDKKLIATLHNISRDRHYEITNNLAVGVSDVKNIANRYGCKVVIVFDSDRDGGLNQNVQLAAASLGHGLKKMGVESNRIKLLTLPNVHARDPNVDQSEYKTGIDDYIAAAGAKSFIDLLLKIYDNPSAFPRMTDVRGFLCSIMSFHNTREQLDQICTVILCEMDADGTRLRERTSGRLFYFYRPTSTMMSAEIQVNNAFPYTDIGIHLYQRFGLNATDTKVLAQLASQFAAEAPVQEVTPRRVRCLITESEDPLNPNGVAVQATDGKYFAVSPDPQKPVSLLNNGTNGILFQRDQVEPIDYEETLKFFDGYIRGAPPLQNWWLEVLGDTNLGRVIKPSEDSNASANPTADETKRMRQYASLLFYLSPWLHRWNGLQLPVEIMLGEAGSGKSSIYELRLGILTGRPVLRNAPKDIKDWNASITNVGGLAAYDNVHWAKNPLRQEISDEICRLTTERDPHVEVRKYYTTADLLRVPVDVNFAFTGIQQPFQNSDLFQRSAVFELIKDDRGYKGSWVKAKLDDYEGRESWMAHHLVFLHRFLRRVRPELENWEENISIGHRLSHLEKCLRIAGEVLGMSSTDLDNITTTITKVQQTSFEGADWTFSILHQFCDFRRLNGFATPDRKFHAQEIVDWVLSQGDLNDNQVATNVRKVGMYIKAHQARLRSDVGLVLLPKYGNSYRFRVMSLDEMEYDKEQARIQAHAESQKRE